jgi:hypothetical protein
VEITEIVAVASVFIALVSLTIQQHLTRALSRQLGPGEGEARQSEDLVGWTRTEAPQGHLIQAP